MDTLDVVGEQIALAIVHVALITDTGNSRVQAAGGRIVATRTGIDQITPRGLGTHTHARRDS
ncbi:hypothetical protein D9M70_653500 [compost metagenome]